MIKVSVKVMLMYVYEIIDLRDSMHLSGTTLCFPSCRVIFAKLFAELCKATAKFGKKFGCSYFCSILLPVGCNYFSRALVQAFEVFELTAITHRNRLNVSTAKKIPDS